MNINRKKGLRKCKINLPCIWHSLKNKQANLIKIYWFLVEICDPGFCNSLHIMRVNFPFSNNAFQNT